MNQNRIKFRVLRQRVLLYTVLAAVSLSTEPMLDSAQVMPSVRFEHLTTMNGLSQSNVKCILKDSQGFMWFGTFDGLNKYDGYRFQVYKTDRDDPYSINGNNIYSLYEDSDGNLWVGTVNGLCTYDPLRDRFDNTIEMMPPSDVRYQNIYAILEYPAGTLWFGTHKSGLYAWNKKENRISQYRNGPDDDRSLSCDRVRALFVDSANRLWIGTSTGGLNLFQQDSQTFRRFEHRDHDPYSIAGNRIETIAEDSRHRLWFGCTRFGLSSLSVSDTVFRFINTFHDPGKETGLASNLILSLCADRSGGLWIGTDDQGIHYLEKEGTPIIHYQTNSDDPNSLNNDAVYSIYQDNVGDLWFGTYSGGINVIHHTSQAFQSFRTMGSAEGPGTNAVWDFQEDAQGGLWIAADGGGLNHFNPRTGKFRRFNSHNTNLPTNAVLAVCLDSKQRIWIGTWAHGLFRFHPESARFTAYADGQSLSPDDNIFNIIEDRHGQLWIATMEHGLIRFDPDNGDFRTYDTSNSDILYNHIQYLAEGSTGRIYFGSTIGWGFFDPSVDRFESFRRGLNDTAGISHTFVTCIYEESPDTLWIATMNGLNRFDLQKGTYTAYFEAQGLPNSAVQAIQPDNAGFLWLSTNRGLSRFDPESGSFSNYVAEDGLQGNEFIRNSNCRTRDGYLYFGGVNGFTKFRPSDMKRNMHIPPVVLTQFHVLNRPVPVGEKGSPLQTHVNMADEVVLRHDQLSFSFQFAALNYVSPLKNQYEYMLEGFDRDWNRAGPERTAVYTNIDPGRYTFRVRGSNNDGMWNMEGKSIRVIVMPPFWNTAWFRILMSFLAGCVLIAGYKMRTAQIRAYSRDLEARVQTRTAQLEAANKELEAFSYSVSHDLRAPLRSMDGFSKVLLEEYDHDLDPAARDFLLRIRHASQKMKQLIDDLLKLSRLTRSELYMQPVNLSGIAENIVQEYSQNHPERKVKCKIAPGLEDTGDLSLLQVMFRNLLDNAWKFTSKNEHAMIEFGTTGQQLNNIYFIRDNGVGFDMRYSDKLFEVFQRLQTEFDGTGIGLATVKRIVHRHHGRIWAEGMVGQGAVFYFTLGNHERPGKPVRNRPAFVSRMGKITERLAPGRPAAGKSKE
ncbi:GHKL domain-containing protein [bacterium]|nr:GHKL domain-containing protein [bacterium]